MILRCVGGSLSGTIFEILPKEEYWLGRDPQNSTGRSLLLPSKTVSRKHCKIFLDDKGLSIEDLESSNGIRINRLRIKKANLKEADILQIGEFTFAVESAEAEKSLSLSKNTENKSLPKPKTSALLKSQYSDLKNKFQKLDFKHRSLILLLLGGIVLHWIIAAPMMSLSRMYLLETSFSGARTAARALGDRNKRELAENSLVLLTCDPSQFQASEAFILDTRGKILCPVGKDISADTLVQEVLNRGEILDNCDEQILFGGGSSCDIVSPIREWRNQQAQYALVGVSRIRFSPNQAFEALQNLQSLSWKTLFLSVAVLTLLWWIWHRSMQRAMEDAAESLHLAVSGTTQSLEKIDNFAALDPVMKEVTRLITKSNQGLKSADSDARSEASFLHVLLKQVLLLEERAVMIVDKENHMLATSPSLSSVVPLASESENLHISEAIADTHLQGELMGFLNDLSSGGQITDRALSLADRILQARGMPLFINDEFVASLIIF